eukprot:scaffold123057_cov63-Phaeocystis_antarctica.AAC.1
MDVYAEVVRPCPLSTVPPLFWRGAREGAAAADEAHRVPREPHARRHQGSGPRRVAADRATTRRVFGGQGACAAHVRPVAPHVQARAEVVVLAGLVIENVELAAAQLDLPHEPPAEVRQRRELEAVLRRADADDPGEHEVVEGRVEVVRATVAQGVARPAQPAGAGPRCDAVQLAPRDPVTVVCDVWGTLWVQ